MSIDFVIGDEVVCIDNTPDPRASSPEVMDLIQVGGVYKVSNMGPHPHPLFSHFIMVQLADVKMNFSGNIRYPMFLATRFRKVQKKFKGMEVLQGLLLTPTKELEHAD